MSERTMWLELNPAGFQEILIRVFEGDVSAEAYYVGMGEIDSLSHFSGDHPLSSFFSSGEVYISPSVKIKRNYIEMRCSESTVQINSLEHLVMCLVKCGLPEDKVKQAVSRTFI